MMFEGGRAAVEVDSQPHFSEPHTIVATMAKPLEIDRYEVME